jgi:hypothetical protein
MPDEKLKLPIEMHKTASLRMPDEDVVDEEYLPRGWGNYMEDIAEAAQAVRRAIDNYGEVHRLVSRMDIPKEVKALADRGMNTAKVTEDNWSGIQDDPFSMNGAWERAVEKGWKPRHIRAGGDKTAASMTKHIRALRRMFPKASKIDTTESGGWNRGGIWTSFGEEGIADYYRSGYPDEFHPKLQKYMDKHGLFGEWQDAGTLMIYPV